MKWPRTTHARTFFNDITKNWTSSHKNKVGTIFVRTDAEATPQQAAHSEVYIIAIANSLHSGDSKDQLYLQH